MATEDYQANWRGARRYQFDEEARRKRAALKRAPSWPVDSLVALAVFMVAFFI